MLCREQRVVARLAGTALCNAAGFHRSYSAVLSSEAFPSQEFISLFILSLSSQGWPTVSSGQPIEAGLAYCELWLWRATHLLCIFLVTVGKKIRTIKRKPISHVRGIIFCLMLG